MSQKKDNRDPSFSVRLPQDVADKVIELASPLATRSAVLRYIICSYFDRVEDNPEEILFHSLGRLVFSRVKHLMEDLPENNEGGGTKGEDCADSRQ